MKENPLLVLIVLAIVAAVVIVLTGHATDGASLLAVLFTVIGLAGGGHLASPADPAAPVSTVVPPTEVTHL